MYNMEYPKSICLTKVASLVDYVPQEFQRYPNGFEILGFMWEHTLPKEGSPFYLYSDKKTPFFRTSVVTEIMESNNQHIVFKTLNSIYEITWKN